MAELAFGQPAAQLLSSAYTQHWYPVLGVLNNPAGESKALPTAYARQVGRSILRYFRGTSTGSVQLPETDDGGDTDSERPVLGWDPVGPARAPRWQTTAFGSVDDVPRRKAWGQRAPGEGAAEDGDLSPRSAGGALSGEGIMTPRWVAKQQQRRPAVVVSLHALLADNAEPMAEEMARNRVCLAARGLAYAAVVIVSRALLDAGVDADQRLAAVAQRAGLDQSQFAVCRPGTAAQFQTFLHGLERALFARAASYYADALMHTQAKMAAIPQLPVAGRPELSVRTCLSGVQGALAVRLAGDSALAAKYSRSLPLRAWLVRYHFKMALFAECAGDRDTAQRCLWLTYIHLLTYVAEIAAGAYLPPSQGDEQPSVGWLWELNGGGSAGDVWQRAHSLRMFGRRWDEALELLEAVNLRLARGWLYQSLDIGALRSMQAGSATASAGAPRYTVAAVNRSGPRAPTRSAVSIGPGATSASIGSASASPISASSAAGRAGVYTGGSLDSLVFSVHAGEMSAATEQMMDAERTRRRDAHLYDSDAIEDAACFVALGSETADIDLLRQPGAAAATDTCGWWPLGGFYAVVDFGQAASTGLVRVREAPRPGLVINSSQDVSCAASLLPADNLYDQCLTLAARQVTEHIQALALILTRSGFGDSSYFWACAERHYSNVAALYLLASSHGMGFARAVRVAMLRMAAGDDPQLQGAAAGRHLIASLVATLRHPSPLPAKLGGGCDGQAQQAHGPPRPTTAFAGFAFGHALAAVDAATGQSNVVARDVATARPEFDAGRMAELKTRSAETTVGALPLRLSAGEGGECLFPLWMWPENAAFLFRSAALASLRRRQQLALENQVYMSGNAGVQGGLSQRREFSANPGVENTYVSLWLVAEQKRSEDADGTCRLLAAAMASLAATSAESQAVLRAAQQVATALPPSDEARLDTLLGLLKTSPNRDKAGTDHFYLYLATELAEAYVAMGSSRPALRIFTRLASRFRAEGWPLLTAHALRWCVHCATALDDPSAAVRAMVELLSPQLVESDAERAQIQGNLEALVRGSPDVPRGASVVDVDMTEIYSPVTSHAHWQHWSLGSGAAEMPFQVTIDCRSLRLPIRLCELAVEFSDAQYSVRVISGVSPVRARDVAVGSAGDSVCFYDIAGAAADGACDGLELRPGCMVVLEGMAAFGEGSVHRPGVQMDVVSLLAVTAVVDTGGAPGKGLELRMRWPTCAQKHEADAAAEESGELQDSVSQSAAENALTRIERLLLGNMGVAKMSGSRLGSSSQLALTLPLPQTTEVGALKRAVRVAGPAASLPINRKWLHISRGDASTGKWLEMPLPPLAAGNMVQGPPSTLDRHASQRVVAPGEQLASSGCGSAEPEFSAYSRCRTLCLPARTSALSLRIPSAAALAPAYVGEAFPVEIEITNVHKTRPISVVELDVYLDTTRITGMMASISDLDASSSQVGADHEAAADESPRGANGAAASVLAPWLQMSPSIDDGGHSGAACETRRLQAIRKLRPVDASSKDDGCGALQPQETRTATVYVRFPAAALHSARRSAATSVAVVKCTVRFAHDAPALPNGDPASSAGSWDGQAAIQASIPTVRPLHADAVLLPTHVAAPVSVLSAPGGPARGLSDSTSAPACEMSSDGEYCFRRPIRVTLCNSGPWDVAVERAVLRPPLVDSEDNGSLPLRVQLAGSASLALGGGDAQQPAVIAAGATLELVFVLDIFTTDVVRIPGDISPGTLEIHWRRVHSVEAGARDAACVLTRLWLPPLHLIDKRVQVESECCVPIAQVGRPLGVCYRVLNPTRAMLSLEVAMHASESFAFAGPRRTTLNLLPGHVGLLRFSMVPLTSIAPPSDNAGDDVLSHVPNHQLLGLVRDQATDNAEHAAETSGSGRPSLSSDLRQHLRPPVQSGATAQRGLREDVVSRRPLSAQSHARGADGSGTVALPPSNVAGLGWTRLPRLDVRIAKRPAHSRSPESMRPTQSPPPSTGLRGLLGTATVTAPPPTREISSLTLSPAAAVADSAAPDTRVRQRTIAALAGLDIPAASGELDDVAPAASGLLTPGLDDEDMLPDYFVHGAPAAGAESDLESSDDEDGSPATRSHHPASTRAASQEADDSEVAILRFDQVAIFCMPSES